MPIPPVPRGQTYLAIGWGSIDVLPFHIFGRAEKLSCCFTTDEQTCTAKRCNLYKIAPVVHNKFIW